MEMLIFIVGIFAYFCGAGFALGYTYGDLDSVDAALVRGPGPLLMGAIWPLCIAAIIPFTVGGWLNPEARLRRKQNKLSAEVAKRKQIEKDYDKAVKQLEDLRGDL